MEGQKIIHDEEPIRLFKSDFMEFFTHISPVAVTILWLPVSIFLFFQPAILGGGWNWVAVPAFLIGLFLWTLAEYTLHRFVFHYHARTPRMERVTFLFHGVHHAQPQCKTRLVMPPVVSLPLAALFYGLFWLVVGSWLNAPGWVNPMMSGFLIGYLVYDLTHYATHHWPMRSRFAKFLKRYHMQHHYKTPNARYGVSSPIWDYVFGTMPG
jgi:sterol desaturase/sphingolipid hydroxylase (fatty acid hydroxylase superfamily)